MIHRWRLVTGLVLFTYVTTHLLNHALGLLSLQAAEAGRTWFLAVWRSPPFTVLLYGSLIVHVGLALWAVYRRRHFRLPSWEIVRLLLGFAIPLQLIPHFVGTRVAHAAFGVHDTYARQVLIYWVGNPILGVEQVALLTVAWLHGCIGLYYWLRVTRARGWALPTVRALAPIVPLLALLGFAAMGQQVDALTADPDWIAATLQPLAQGQLAELETARNAAWAVVFGALVLVLMARQTRALWARRHGFVYISYPDGQRVAVLPGTTVLEASRGAAIPHASLCGGRGRCSTCRSRIGAGLDALAPPSADEARVLRRVQAAPDVRLACQVRPAADVEVFPLLPPAAPLPAGALLAGQAAGAERELAILFADMRDFTKVAERRLPYDVVFLLNQYSAAMGRAIERAGGLPNQFVGDGIMALFGLELESPEACRQALLAAVNMAQALDQLNRALRHDLREPLRIGIGIHTGPVVVGEMGYGRARYLTAIGDVVNTASRLEALTKELACQLVVSEDVAARAGVDLGAFPSAEFVVRGRSTPLRIRAVPSALALEAALGSSSHPIGERAPAPREAAAG